MDAPKILFWAVISTVTGAAPVLCYGQTVVHTPTTIPTATSQTHLTPFSWAATPAWLRTDTSSSIVVWAVPSRLGVGELRTLHGMIHHWSATWSYAAGLSTLALDRYSELSGALAIASTLSSQLSAAVAASYTYAQARGFAAEHLVLLNAQMVFALDSSSHIGIGAQNITQTERAGSLRGSLQRFALGVSRRQAGVLTFDADLVLPLRMPAGFAFAVRWDAIESLSLRAGWTTVPHGAELSARLILPGSWHLLSTLHYHLLLGITTAVGIGYQW